MRKKIVKEILMQNRENITMTFKETGGGTYPSYFKLLRFSGFPRKEEVPVGARPSLFINGCKIYIATKYTGQTLIIEKGKEFDSIEDINFLYNIINSCIDRYREIEKFNNKNMPYYHGWKNPKQVIETLFEI